MKKRENKVEKKGKIRWEKKGNERGERGEEGEKGEGRGKKRKNRLERKM